MPRKVGAGGARVNVRDLGTGILLLGAAGFFAINGVSRLNLGTASSMGPGFFPVMIATGLAFTALLIIIRSFGTTSMIDGFASPRALLCILAAPIVFALGVEPFGFVPTMVTTMLIASFSSSRMTWRFALALTAGITLLCTILFLNLLQMPVLAFGDLLSS